MKVKNLAVSAHKLLNASELSSQLGMSVSTIYRKRSLGEPLPKAVKIGGSVRWKQSSVDEFIVEMEEW